MDFAQLLNWGSAVRLVGWLGTLFIFWRSNRDEAGSDNLFGAISQMFINGIIIYIISYIILVPAGIVMMVYLLFAVKYHSREHKYDLWLSLDNLVPALLWLFAVDSIAELLSGLYVWQTVKLILILLYAGIAYPWSKRNYKILSWYPSGKPGFIVLMFIFVWSLVELPFAYFKRPGLYWQDLVMLACLVGAGYCWQKQSGNNRASGGNLLLKMFKMRRKDVS